MAHRSAVEIIQQDHDGGIDICEVEEAPVAQPRHYPALDDQHRPFNLAFVARLAAAGWQNGRVVMLGKSGIGR